MRPLISIAVVAVTAAMSLGQTRAASYFQFTTDDFWLNLHHYLYILGRAHAGAADATQPAVASAPDDEKQGLVLLTDEERQSWANVVGAYASGVSRASSFFQAPLASMTMSLANTGDGAVFPVATWQPGDRATLETAAPMYRKAWWPRHRAMNQRYLAELQRTIDRDGSAIVAFLTRIYGIEWPSRVFPTHVVAYASWQGAFSYTGRMMILSSNANAQNDQWSPLEGVFHEAMHQSDDRVAALLRAQAAARGVTVPVDLSHALIFFTVGEAVRRLHPEHVSMVDALDIWSKTISGARLPAKRLQPSIQGIWKPYLDGRGTRDEALGALVAAAAAVTE